MRVLHFEAIERAHPHDVRVASRSIADMIAGRNAPEAPDGVPGGARLSDLGPRDCRFPVSSQGGLHRFCAAEVTDWRPGKSLGCYCTFHRNYLSRQPNVMDDKTGEAA